MIRPYEHPDREYARLMEQREEELERDERLDRDTRHRPLARFDERYDPPPDDERYYARWGAYGEGRGSRGGSGVVDDGPAAGAGEGGRHRAAAQESEGRLW